MGGFKLVTLIITMALIVASSVSAVGADYKPGFWCPGAVTHPDDGVYACERTRDGCESVRSMFAKKPNVIAPPCEHQSSAVTYSWYDVPRARTFSAFWRNTQDCRYHRMMVVLLREDVRNVSECRFVD